MSSASPDENPESVPPALFLGPAPGRPMRLLDKAEPAGNLVGRIVTFVWLGRWGKDLISSYLEDVVEEGVLEPGRGGGIAVVGLSRYNSEVGR